MLNWLRAPARRVMAVAVASAPWVASMYAFFWLHDRGVWNPQTPHRGKLSVALLAAGMLGSFLLHSYIEKRRHR
jgi:hypothetical protein